MKNKVACCYLTYGHPEAMEEVLEHICEPYGKKGIDIYVYDSSEDNDTEEIVRRYTEKERCRLYYIPVRFIASGDEKYLYVIRQNGLEDHYDYVWPVKDRCWFSGETLDNICTAIDEDHDLVFTADERDRFELVKHNLKEVYTDPVEFFADYGALTTNWECIIRRTDTMLDPVDWDKYVSLYGIGEDNNFNQTVTTFVRLSEMDKCSVRVVPNGINDKHYSDKAVSMWNSRLLEVWIDRWIPAIYSLPSIYDEHKLAVIKTQLGHVSLFGSNDSLIAMRDSGLLTSDRIDQLSSMWGMISRLPYDNLQKILAHEEKSLFNGIYEEYIHSFSDHDYEKGYYLFFQNGWMSDRIDSKDYVDIGRSYYIYAFEIRTRGYSMLFDGVDSIEDLTEKFRKMGG
ncbi:MAG: hypothetical protein J5910_02700 [Lachnospiraceae bacterium]|nr:hypothetical protein [Lachnospiraceae bacterium]